MNSPSSQITTDVIMQSSIKSLERLVVSKHEAFVSSLSVYEKMLKELERILFLHENFMEAKKDALDSSLKDYEMTADGLRDRLETFEAHVEKRQNELTDIISAQRDEFKRINETAFEYLRVNAATLQNEMAARLSDLEKGFAAEKEIFVRCLDSYGKGINAFEARVETTQARMAAFLSEQSDELKNFGAFILTMDKSMRAIYWLLGANAILTLSLLARWFVK